MRAGKGSTPHRWQDVCVCVQMEVIMVFSGDVKLSLYVYLIAQLRLPPLLGLIIHTCCACTNIFARGKSDGRRGKKNQNCPFSRQWLRFCFTRSKSPVGMWTFSVFALSKMVSHALIPSP